jgi:hypothetical protein
MFTEGGKGMTTVRELMKDYAPMAAIVGITVVACVAISQGVNSWLVSLAYAALAGLGGFELHKKISQPPKGEMPLERLKTPEEL